MDLTSPKVINEIKNKFGFAFKKGLGQNFLTDRTVLEKIADAASDADGVIEIGPGFGVLTGELCEKFSKVVSIELDDRLIEVLDYTMAGYDNLKIIHNDVLKCNMPQIIADEFGEGKVAIAANLPYYITTPIITSVIESRLNISSLVVMIQKEVAERICAKPGTKSYGAISVLCQYYTEPSIVTTVSAGKFVPPPKVDSAVVKMQMLDEPSVSVSDEKLFFRVVKAAFSQRRKTLLNCLASAFSYGKENISERMLKAGIEPARRGETLSLSEFAALCEQMGERE